MDYAAFTEDLKKVLQPILDQESIELVELISVKTKKNLLLRLLVDRSNGGISLGDCVKLNEKIRDHLDTTNIVGPDYMLEVSSPGADRPLKTKKDFLRCINKRVKFFLKDAINGKIETVGIIASVEENNVGIDVSGRVLHVPLGNILRAKQVIE
ncbi:MAG: ribosome maturation factor RimP [Candidatus Omnitrophota bacterium]